MNTSCSNFSADSLVFSGRNILPAVLKILSTGADEAGIDNTVFAVLAACGNCIACDIHHSSGSSSYSTWEVCKYSISSLRMVRAMSTGWVFWDEVFMKLKSFNFFAAGSSQSSDASGWSDVALDSSDTECLSAYFCISLTTVLLISSTSFSWHQWSLKRGSSTAPVMYSSLDSYFDRRLLIAEHRALTRVCRLNEFSLYRRPLL